MDSANTCISVRAATASCNGCENGSRGQLVQLPNHRPVTAIPSMDGARFGNARFISCKTLNHRLVFAAQRGPLLLISSIALKLSSVLVSVPSLNVRLGDRDLDSLREGNLLLRLAASIARDLHRQWPAV